MPAELQIAALKRRDCFAPCLLQGGSAVESHKDPRACCSDPGRFPCFSGRAEVLPMHPDLERSGALLVSGHHGELSVPARDSPGAGRIICDYSGGNPTARRPLCGVILPERLVVSSNRQHGGLLRAPCL